MILCTYLSTVYPFLTTVFTVVHNHQVDGVCSLKVDLPPTVLVSCRVGHRPKGPNLIILDLIFFLKCFNANLGSLVDTQIYLKTFLL